MDFWVILILHSSQLSVFLWSLIAILIFWIEMLWKLWNVSDLFHIVSSLRDLTVYCYCCGVLCTDCIGCYQPEWNPLLSWEITWRGGGGRLLCPGEDVTPAAQYQTHRHPAQPALRPSLMFDWNILDISNCEILHPPPPPPHPSQPTHHLHPPLSWSVFITIESQPWLETTFV